MILPLKVAQRREKKVWTPWTNFDLLDSLNKQFLDIFRLIKKIIKLINKIKNEKIN